MKRCLIFIFMFVAGLQQLFSAGTITVQVTCFPEPIVLHHELLENGKYEYGDQSASYDAGVYWDDMHSEWHLFGDFPEGYFLFSSTIDVGADPPCLLEGQWELEDGMSSCSFAQLNRIEFSDGHCNGIPTLSQWGFIILGLGLTVFGIVAAKQRIFSST